MGAGPAWTRTFHEKDSARMPQLAANLTLMFGEVDFLDRFQAARDAGFQGVECQFPFNHAPDDVKARMDGAGVRMVLHNLPAGDWMDGEPAVACRPERTDAFRAGVTRGVDYARAIGCPRLNCLAGVRPDALDATVARDTLIANLDYAAAQTRAAGLDLVMEPINTFDVPGRHEPGTGAIDVAGLFGQLDRLGYAGWVGCEYVPAATTRDGLDWAAGYLA